MILTPLLLIGVVLYGLPLALLVDARLRGFALAGAAFLLGMGAISLHLFALGAMGVPWTRTWVLLSLVPLLAWSAAARPPLSKTAAPPPHSKTDLVTVLFIAAYAIFALWAPPYEWDYYGIWGLKAKWFYEARAIDWEFVRTNISKPDYPLLVPLSFDFVAIVTGRWNERAFGWLFVFFCASLVAIARDMFARELRWPALATLAVVFPSLNLWIGLGEAAVMAYGCAGLLFIRAGSMRMAAILFGLAAWSKNEGMAWMVTAAVALVIATRSVRSAIALWPAAVMIAPWIVVRVLLHLPTELAQGALVNNLTKRLAHPAATFQALWSARPDQPWFWLAVAVTIVLYARSAWHGERFLLAAVLLQAAALVVPLLGTPFDLAAHASFSLNRIPFQIAPAAAFLAAVLLMRDIERPRVPFTDPPERSQNP